MRVVQLAFEMKEQLGSDTLDHIGDLLDENWCLKAQLTAGITDPQIDDWYAARMTHGAVGGKLMGAGNGGFMMFYAPKERHPKI
jgi:D-glycero-alpha-D-manno-heptose-7-phosphate kinase